MIEKPTINEPMDGEIEAMGKGDPANDKPVEVKKDERA